MNAPFRKERRRILSLWFPHLSTERLLRQRLGRSWRSLPPQGRPPLVVSRQENNTQRIAALDEEARRLRLRPGMGIADARAMYPSIEIVAEDVEADRRLLAALADQRGLDAVRTAQALRRPWLRDTLARWLASGWIATTSRPDPDSPEAAPKGAPGRK